MLCPKCNHELEVDDSFDISITDDWCTERVIGCCPICETEYQWERNYKFYNEDDLVECL